MRTRGKSSVFVFAMMSAMPFWPPPLPSAPDAHLAGRQVQVVADDEHLARVVELQLLDQRHHGLAAVVVVGARLRDARCGGRRSRPRPARTCRSSSSKSSAVLLREPVHHPEADVAPVARVLLARIAEREHEADVVRRGLRRLAALAAAEDALEEAGHASPRGFAASRRNGTTWRRRVRGASSLAACARVGSARPAMTFASRSSIASADQRSRRVVEHAQESQVFGELVERCRRGSAVRAGVSAPSRGERCRARVRAAAGAASAGASRTSSSSSASEPRGSSSSCRSTPMYAAISSASSIAA